MKIKRKEKKNNHHSFIHRSIETDESYLNKVNKGERKKEKKTKKNQKRNRVSTTRVWTCSRGITGDGQRFHFRKHRYRFRLLLLAVLRIFQVGLFVCLFIVSAKETTTTTTIPTTHSFSN
ncbi:Hypothetical predicted protein [Octopus vulgaris]|uniref:Transmembrane protein n=1 Tax=Octopus vulgaris TaxID=6645 RepID=A0AA36AMN2_OCTVU|nr:Hypothetical predicted protein [Octopus vulgaris]